MKELKLFVGGYFDDRIFIGDEFEDKTPFGKDINTYTLSEAIELGFVQTVKEYYEEENEKEWEEITDDEKIKAIINYVDGDEIAGLLYFNTEEEAEKYKNDVIKEVEEREKEIEYVGKKQDEYGNYREVYQIKE